MAGSRPGKAVRLAASCTECQRRKQKCSRQWPCNHCQARKISHLCRYAPKRASKASKSSVEAARNSSPSEQATTIKSESNDMPTTDMPALAEKDGFRALGYMPDDQDPLIGDATLQSNKNMSVFPSDSMSSEMKHALRLMPPKPYTEILVQHFLDQINYTYYCVYPPTFSQDYSSWWSDRANGKPLTPEFTCLLLRVCACSALYLDPDHRHKLEAELGESIESLSESYHHAAKQLSNTICPGKGGLTQVQQLFLTATWYKSESLFIESWHALSSCIHEAQELGMHKPSKPGSSEFTLELRRRVWCLISVWDWQMALLLSRPLIINPSCQSFELPNDQLEGFDPETGPPSPVTHIGVQYLLGRIITKAPGAMDGTLDAAYAESIRNDINVWFTRLPPAYRLTDPVTQWDEEYKYVPIHRRQLHAIGYMTMLQPFKAYLTRAFDSTSSETERNHRGTAVDIALRLMEVSRQLFDQIFPINAKFHLLTFLVFDTSAYLSSAVIHDKNRSIPRRAEIIQSVELACSMMAKLARVTKTGAICFPILSRLTKSLGISADKTDSVIGDESTTTEASTGRPDALGDLDGLSFGEPISPDSLPSLDSLSAPGMFAPADLPMPGMETPPMTALSDFYNVDIGQLDQIWDWQDLDLTLLPSLPS